MNFLEPQCKEGERVNRGKSWRMRAPTKAHQNHRLGLSSASTLSYVSYLSTVKEEKCLRYFFDKARISNIIALGRPGNDLAKCGSSIVFLSLVIIMASPNPFKLRSWHSVFN